MDAIFLKLDNIKGESQVEGFEDQIEIMSYSHNVAMQVSNDVSLTERTSGRAHVGEMSLTKFVDLATPVLNEYCCSGRLIRTAVLTLCRNDDGKMRSLIVYTLTNVLISQLSVSGGAGGKPVETMSLNFTKIEWQITAEKSDGAQQESRTSVWDLAMDQIGK
ncbi:type VI secretion system tube protein Hcp [Salmonella enterica]|uniref:Hcp1 family type VI secretion system effector n=3 Tax=Salmonella enterica TaxID=28901 RepID=A0A5U8BU60_SALER|nr:Hcp family type VI secretion system effector [Salmonella enterica]EAW1992908.1 Hcp1 family type VI secretion system effector [Salmonella enterica subsp. enterica]EBM9779751.1 type VI secretion system tube protein Hcp [Salmonella enterica subsp. enterica serovar Enteritidis]ECF6493638.1 type VI secretion system tube protein Hcp [Salmonella enterica subsp. enterica serovar Infantis]ECU5735143.1 Hcp1 family type VI secretion system effector [Salmonella enterica subsp. enterica serovar Typhimuri